MSVWSTNKASLTTLQRGQTVPFPLTLFNLVSALAPATGLCQRGAYEVENEHKVFLSRQHDCLLLNLEQYK